MTAREEFPIDRVDFGPQGVHYTIDPGHWHEMCDELDRRRPEQAVYELHLTAAGGGFWVIAEEDLVNALRGVAAGTPPDIAMLEIQANSRPDRDDDD